MDTPQEPEVKKFETGAFEAFSLLAEAWGKELKSYINCSRDEAVDLTRQQSQRLFDKDASVYDLV